MRQLPWVVAASWVAVSIGCAPAASPRPSTATSTAGSAATRAQRRAAKSQAIAAYERKDFAACARLFEQSGDPYSAACCHAQAGDRDAAFAALARAIDDSPQISAIDKDSDLDPLHGDPRWRRELDHYTARTAEYRRTINAELAQLYDEDQADRAGPFDKLDWTQITPRDEVRRKRVDQIIAAGGAHVADHYYHAAMVYQHGSTGDEIQRAHDLAVKAVELDPGHDAAKWLAAAAEDRKLMYEKKPQKWGTQFQQQDGKWVLWPVDPAITDEQRDAWNVPPLADAKAHAAQLNASAP